MSGDEPITNWLRQLEARDQEAARQLWQWYYRELVALARARFGRSPRRVIDEEDVALSVMRCLHEGAISGQFTDVVNRRQLWQMLATITVRKVIDKQRLLNQKRRGGGMVRGDSVFKRGDSDGSGSEFDQISANAPTPEMLAIAAEEYQRLMRRLNDDRLRQIAQYKLDGYKNEEIAARLGLACRSIERKLHRIREIWAEELSE